MNPLPAHTPRWRHLDMSPAGLKHLTLGVILLVIVISFTLLWLGYLSQTRIERVLETQFNEQQLILARKIADDIEQQLDYLHQFLRDLGQQKTTLLNPGQFRQHLAQVMGNLSAFDVMAVVEYGPDGEVQGSIGYLGPIDSRDLCGLSSRICSWFQQGNARHRMFLSGILYDQDRFSQQRNFMLLVSPVFTPGSREISGYLGFYLDPMAIAFRHTWDVQSGRTGYAWVIDAHGLTLAHNNADLVGENYLSAREARYPGLDLTELEKLVTTQMLQRQEGLGKYISGGHRGRRGEVAKLVAFSPVYLIQETSSGSSGAVKDIDFWVVAVTAPREEVYSLTRGIMHQQVVMMGIFQLCLLLGGGTIIYFSYRGLNFLEAELARQAAALAENHERLLHAERFAVLGRAMTHVTHEIKNPLAIIGGFAHQLLRHPEMPEAYRDKIHIINTEVKRLEKFLGEIRDLTRPRAPSRRMSDYNEIVAETLAFMRPLWEERQLQLQVNLDNGLPALWLDPDQIRQVVVNLVKNAAEAVEERGMLAVATHREGDFLVMEVQDDGCGIPPEKHQEVFDPFFTTKPQGTGLGLAISQKIIEDHGGTIRLSSEAGKGAKFSVHLPIPPGP